MMTEVDPQRIEKSLGIQLPEVYRALMLRFPIRYHSGNADSELWDNADQLIRCNKELHGEWYKGFRPWPPHFFFIGDPLSASAYFIDLRDPLAPVSWAEGCNLESSSCGVISPSFRLWSEQYLREVVNDLEKDGINPDAEPER